MSAITCPNCAAVHELENPGIVVVVCDRCDSTLYLEEDVVYAGERAKLAEPRSSVAVGATGEIAGKHVKITGRMRMQHETGSWDEWTFVDNNGESGWLIEDERRYSLEYALPAVPDGAHPGLKLGDELAVGGVNYEVREFGSAVCAGGEGQLPRSFQPGENYRYVDMVEVGGARLLLLEFDKDGNGEAFFGRSLPAKQVQLTGGNRPAIPQEAQTASTISCPNCGAPFTVEPQGEPVQTACCSNCDSILALDGAAATVAYRQKKEDAPTFVLEIGDKGKIEGETWEVMGRMLYSDMEGYKTQEFLLWSKTGGYLYLEFDNGHFAWTKPSIVSPQYKKLIRMHIGQTARMRDKAFVLRAAGLSTLMWVDGALPWNAKLRETTRCYDFSDPPYYLSVEVDEGEIKAYEGAWIDRYEVFKAFNRKPRGDTDSVHIAQPNPSGWMVLPGTAAGLILGMNLVIALISPMFYGRQVVEFAVPSTAAHGSSFESPAFELSGSTVGLFLTAPSIDNSWVWVDVELISLDDDFSVGYTGLEVGYYHGFEGGESWTEGSRSENNYFSGPPAGKYIIEASLEYDRPTSVQVEIYEGSYLSRFNIVMVLLFIFPTLLPFWAYNSFEARRKEDA